MLSPLQDNFDMEMPEYDNLTDEKYKVLQFELGRMPESIGKEIFLMVLDGKSLTEIYEITGQHPNTCRTQKQRFMHSLRKKLMRNPIFKDEGTGRMAKFNRDNYKNKQETVASSVYKKGDRFVVYHEQKYVGTYDSAEKAIEAKNELIR